MDNEYYGCINVYAQLFPHDDLYISATKEGLEQLKNIIENILNNNVGRDSFNTSNSDGEGYEVVVTLYSDEQINNLRTYYVSDGIDF